MTQSIKSTGRFNDLDLTASLARCFTQLKLTRSRYSDLKLDLSTIAAVKYQLELCDLVLFYLAEVHSNLSSEMPSNVWRPGSALPNRQNVEGVRAGRGQRSGRVRGRN